MRCGVDKGHKAFGRRGDFDEWCFSHQDYNGAGETAAGGTPGTLTKTKLH